jgi:hypothetical protein
VQQQREQRRATCLTAGCVLIIPEPAMVNEYIKLRLEPWSYTQLMASMSSLGLKAIILLFLLSSGFFSCWGAGSPSTNPWRLSRVSLPIYIPRGVEPRVLGVMGVMRVVISSPLQPIFSASPAIISRVQWHISGCIPCPLEHAHAQQGAHRRHAVWRCSGLAVAHATFASLATLAKVLLLWLMPVYGLLSCCLLLSLKEASVAMFSRPVDAAREMHERRLVYFTLLTYY